ncbi:MAG TPA: tRNA 4-thiouridine(8) synthase ThiI [Firmicutes bacterium]|nr:tRNA 4-thiouridine(8) synthase ThiI [Bacillota bacterium]
MIYDRILVRYGELSIKGKNRKYFIDALQKNIRRKLKPLENVKYEVTRDRFYIILNGTDPKLVTDELDKVFGMQSYSLAARCENDIEEMKKLALDIINEQPIVPTTFKVDTKRANKQFPMQSHDITKAVGAHLLINTEHLKVDVHKPQLKVFVEVRREGTYIMAEHIKGLGGFPVGISGKGLLMISGGIDSPVAGYLMQKRGVEIEAIHFASPPYTSVRSKQKVLDLMEKLAHYAPYGKVKVHVIPFTELQSAIYENIPNSYTMTVMRRMMYRIAEGVAAKRNTLILGNGESLGQVASQTLASMYAINAVTNMPIIRPVATLDKNEIIEIAKKIDTYEISIRPYEDCCTVFVPENPATNPSLEKCVEYEQNFDFAPFVQKCIDESELITVRAGEIIELENNAACAINDLF